MVHTCCSLTDLTLLDIMLTSCFIGHLQGDQNFPCDALEPVSVAGTSSCALVQLFHTSVEGSAKQLL